MLPVSAEQGGDIWARDILEEEVLRRRRGRRRGRRRRRRGGSCDGFEFYLLSFELLVLRF